jgi:REP element-mobilizing transposase RayT
MSTEKFQNKYRIPSARALWHNYSGGAYFVTVCTQNREHFFGKIVCAAQNDPQMQLTPIGQWLHENLQNITAHYPYAEIPLFVVMPNHWHAVVFIDSEKIPYQRRNTEMLCDVHVETRRATSLQTDGTKIETRRATSLQTDGTKIETRRATSLQTDGTKNEKMQKIANLQGWLSVAIGGIKSAVTKFASKNSIDFAWQTRFDDRIIRNQNEMEHIADYIEHNVVRWEKNCFNKNK